MKLVLGISVCFVSAIIVFLTYIIHDKIQREQIQRQTETESFIVSEYFSRMEQAALKILESQKPVDQTIILWLGLDGLRMNKDGTTEWINRKKPKPTLSNVFYQPSQSIQPIKTGMLLADQTQSTIAQIDALMVQSRQSTQIVSSLQQCCVQYPSWYPSYLYGGCCNFKR